MGLLSLFHNRRPFAEYKRLRETGRHLNQVLVERLPKEAILASAKKLGLRKGRSLVFNSEHEMPVLLDYCLYTVRTGGKTSIERYSVRNPPPETSDQMTLLRAMRESHYSVFQVKGVQRGRGATLFDILRYETFDLMDSGIGSTAVSGMFFAGRVLPVAEYYMTSGAFIPLTPDFFKRRVIPALEKHCSNAPADESFILSPTQEAAFSAQIIRAALREGQLEMVGYE
jgi:hypothetical protein